MNFDDFGEILTNPTGTKMRETGKPNPSVSQWHAPNGMQMNEWNETPKQ